MMEMDKQGAVVEKGLKEACSLKEESQKEEKLN